MNFVYWNYLVWKMAVDKMRDEVYESLSSWPFSHFRPNGHTTHYNQLFVNGKIGDDDYFRYDVYVGFNRVPEEQR